MAMAPGGPVEPSPPIRRTRSIAALIGRGELMVVALIAFGFVAHLTVVSRLEHNAAQVRLYARLRDQLANGVAPVGQVSDSGRLLANGTPMALLEIPRLHLREVVSEATTSAVLTQGPGHQRNTPFPGQPGTSVIDGRAAAYGGPFGGLHRLRAGDPITVTTGEGTSHFKVIDTRNDGGPSAPPLAAGAARLTLVTARGLPYVPVGVTRVDADLVGAPLAPSPMPVTAVLRSDLPLGTQTDSIYALVLWLEALVAVAVLGIWCWRRWSPVRTWIVGFPVGALVLYYVFGQTVRLFPNLL
jgi:sortase A